MTILLGRGATTLPIAQARGTFRHLPRVPDSMPRPIPSRSPCPSGRLGSFSGTQVVVPEPTPEDAAGVSDD